MAKPIYRYIGLALHPDTNDLYLFSDGSLGIAVSNQAIGEHAKQRLNTYLGEWVYDTTVGTPWIQQIFVRPFSPGVANAVIKQRISETPGVTELTEFSLTVDYKTRGVKAVGAKVTTELDGEVSIYI